jgi:hypothetical protein
MSATRRSITPMAEIHQYGQEYHPAGHDHGTGVAYSGEPHLKSGYLPTICSVPREFSQAVSINSVSGTNFKLIFAVHGLV